ncbi:MAG: type II toxin-antitoxin system VapC family toxin [Gemmatimonadetes bacterium]|nr:type II toxin-antitoxin system VapC family toxin [Gemmatimonadota bacterium]
MNGFLLDTNVVSELTKNVPNSQVITFLAAQNDLWLSIIVLHELDFGLNLLPLGRRRDRISAVLAAFVTEYEDRILPVDRPEAEQAASLRAQARRSGRVLHLGDALIAGTAKTHNLAVATRNVADFDGLDVDVTNPWEAT